MGSGGSGTPVSPAGAWLVMRSGAHDAPEDSVDLRALPRVDPAGFDAALAGREPEFDPLFGRLLAEPAPAAVAA